jgi:hypothetical protein
MLLNRLPERKSDQEMSGSFSVARAQPSFLSLSRESTDKRINSPASLRVIRRLPQKGIRSLLIDQLEERKAQVALGVEPAAKGLRLSQGRYTTSQLSENKDIGLPPIQKNKVMVTIPVVREGRISSTTEVE